MDICIWYAVLKNFTPRHVYCLIMYFKYKVQTNARYIILGCNITEHLSSSNIYRNGILCIIWLTGSITGTRSFLFLPDSV